MFFLDSLNPLSDVCFVDNEFTVAGWPARKRDARAALHDMRDTHRVNVMPAYDAYSVQILPSRYEAALRGADVQVYFSMLHWAIGQGEVINSDTMVCDVRNMRVTIPPRAKMQPRTPTKRVSQTDPFTPAFTKKHCTE